jgi:hypothetical protein
LRVLGGWHWLVPVSLARGCCALDLVEQAVAADRVRETGGELGAVGEVGQDLGVGAGDAIRHLRPAADRGEERRSAAPVRIR